MLDNYPDILTIKEVMEILKIGRNKAYYMINHKQIKSIKIGNSYRIPKIALIEFIINTVSA
jgi:excisionase family DNA binding protein